MATTQLSKVSVAKMTPFGFKDSTGEYINWSKNLDDSAKKNVVPGKTLNMELYIADSGKKYVNKVLGVVEETPRTVTKATGLVMTPVTEKAKAHIPNETKVKEEAMTRADWDSKDRRISRQGVIQAAVQAIANLGMVSEPSDLFPLAEELANQMLEFVNK